MLSHCPEFRVPIDEDEVLKPRDLFILAKNNASDDHLDTLLHVLKELKPDMLLLGIPAFPSLEVRDLETFEPEA